MPARRTSKLMIKGPLAAVPDVTDAKVGGVGLDWDCPPDVLDERALAEWQRLAKVYVGQPTRFREGDRAVLAAYCLAWSVYLGANAELARDGLLVDGRSSPDRGRRVKSPALVVWTQAASQLRYLARELGLTPDARGRSGIREHEADPDPSDLLTNPFIDPHRSRS